MNVGLISVYFDRGSGVICQQIKQALQWHIPNCNIAILARMSVADNKKQLKFWDNFSHNNILLYPEYKVEDSDFEQWIISNKLDSVIFVEEMFTTNLVSICQKLSIKSINYIVWENFNPSQIEYYKKFTYLVCPTLCTFNLLRNEYLLDNTVFVPWGINLDFFKFQEPVRKDKPIIFFPAGFGGVHDRKNEEAVLKAFSYVCPRDKMTLHVHTQQEGKAGQGQNLIKSSGTVNENQLIQYYKESDLVVLPSRWEGNCLPQQESLALGRPVIVTDCKPLNERVVDGETGLLIKVKELKEVPEIFCKSAEVDVIDFSEKLILMENIDKLQEMQIASRKYAEQNLDWKINSKHLIDILI